MTRSASDTVRRALVLTGFMGVGKTVTGRELSRLTGMPLYDTDLLIEERTGLTVAEIFARKGETFFRDAETELLQQLAASPHRFILATGGGIVQRLENRELLRRIGVVVNLTADPENILARIRLEPGVRPLLQVPDPEVEVRRLLAAREAAYADCDVRIRTDCRTPAEVAAEILRCIAAVQCDSTAGGAA